MSAKTVFFYYVLEFAYMHGAFTTIVGTNLPLKIVGLFLQFAGLLTISGILRIIDEKWLIILYIFLLSWCQIFLSLINEWLEFN